MRPRRPKMAPRWAKMAKTDQVGAKTPQDAAKTLQDGAETVQERQITKTLKNLRKNKVFEVVLELSWEGFGKPRRAQDGPRWRARAAREQAKRAKRAERRHAVPSRPRICDSIAIKREIRENRETGREEDHMF